ncbi:hypothetical protein Pint_11634 [Pistacia integerrima]|uniref:Uncharacterized protein n=1 Tax=Pistacia integerrima TaxID=434235 RepID=A0ACC0XNC4_9ROSI|nr:hypothetical protein Pint_11634 [Pistacia integerrima]
MSTVSTTSSAPPTSPIAAVDYTVVAIVGPQSSGKSTLMNHLFDTKFKEMDAFEGRSQTTKGIWIDKCAGIEPFTIAMDLEGTDGCERGEDDTAFEKQSALFALAIADVVVINIWCHDIGREQASNRPLLKTVFQVMMRLFSPRKTTLLFVIRDKTKTPLEKLESNLREDIKKIWEAVPKPRDHEGAPLSEFFNVEVTALSSYEEMEEKFKEQVAKLREQFFHSISPGRLAGDSQRVVPASGFSFSNGCQLFGVKKLSNEKLHCLFANEGLVGSWKEDIQVGSCPRNLRKRLDAVLDTYLSEYDRETIYFDDDVRTVKRQYLQSKALEEADKRVPNWPAPTPAPAPPSIWSNLPAAVSIAVSVAGFVVNFLT